MKALAVIIALLTAITYIGIVTISKVAPDWPTRGIIGDSFGLLNALYSGLAFAGLIYAILLQRQDLALQREELSLTRVELSKSASAQEATAQSQNNLAMLNAYTALLNCKNAEISEALTTFHAVSKSESKRKIGERYRKLLRERSTIEARIENVLLLMGGECGFVSNSDTNDIDEADN